MSIPIEIPKAAREKLLWEYCRVNFVNHGMIADIALHGPEAGDNRNHHAHVMLTMRNVTADGFGAKNRAWNDQGLLEDWKASWQDMCNTALKKAGSAVRVDRRSIAERRDEQLAFAKQASDWIAKRRFEIEAQRLSYTPRTYLVQSAWRAMVADDKRREEATASAIDPELAISKAVAEPDPDYEMFADRIDAWRDAVQSRIEARAIAARMEQELEEEIAAWAAADLEGQARNDTSSDDGKTNAGADSHKTEEEVTESPTDDSTMAVATNEDPTPDQADNPDDDPNELEIVATPSQDEAIDREALGRKLDEPLEVKPTSNEIVVQSEKEAADAALLDVARDREWRSERIALSRKRVLNGRTAIDRATAIWGSLKRGVRKEAPAPFAVLRAATDRFLKAASNLLQAWKDFLARLRDDDFQDEEDEYIDASSELLKAQSAAEQPGDLTVEELGGEQRRIAEILDLGDADLIAPIEKSTMKRTEQITAYVESEEGRAVLEDHARHMRLAENRKQKEIEDKRQADQNERLYRAGEKRANLVRPILKKARRDPEVRLIVEQRGFDLNQTDSWLMSSLRWHLVEDADSGSLLEIIEREIAKLEARRLKNAASHRNEQTSEASDTPEQTSKKTRRPNSRYTPDI